MKRRKLISIICFFAFICSARADKPFKIGVCLALTGEAAKWSAAHVAGIELAAQKFKKRGVPLELVFDDTGIKTAGSVTCMQRMTEHEQVEGVIGNIWGFLTMPMADLAERKKLPLVSTSVFRSRCPQDSKYLFSVSEQVEDLEPTYQGFLSKQPDLKRIGIAYFDDGEWGVINRDAVKNAARNTGREIIDIISTDDLHADFKSLFPRMLKKNPDAIFVFYEPLTTSRALRGLNYTGVVVHSNALDEQFWDTGAASDVFEGVYFADIALPDQFRDDFKKFSGHDPILEPHSGHDALTVLVRALQLNRRDPVAALRTETFEGVGQSLSFQNSCAAKHSTWKMFQIVDGRRKAL